jgi:hypothetical protein
VFRVLNQPYPKYGSDIVQVHIQKVKRKENGKQGIYEVAPDFKNGGVYRPVNQHEKKISIEKDRIDEELGQIPF